MLQGAHYTLNYMYHHETPCIFNHKWLILHNATLSRQSQTLLVITLYTKLLRAIFYRPYLTIRSTSDNT